MCTPEIQKRIIENAKKTMLEKYGKEHWSKTESGRKYLSKKIGSEEVQKKFEETCLTKYEVKNPSQKNIINYKKFNKEYIEENFINENGNLEIDKMVQFYNISETTAHKFLRENGIEYKKLGGISRAEKEIVEYIKSFYSEEVIENSKEIIKPQELDIFIPNRNIAVEFNGIYWHSFGYGNLSPKQADIDFQRQRHLLKTELCEEKGINLLHIFENEWLDPIKQEIWKSIIKYKLGFIDKKYYARKLKLKEIDNNTASQFFEENHLQGGQSLGSIKLGLFDENNNLISSMTFGKPRFNKNYEYELIRFASQKGTSCVGCAQKLFKYFIENYKPSSVISYANRRWASSLSNVYQKMNFEFIEKTKPGFYYFHISNPFEIYHRVKFQKHKLKELKEFDNYDDNKTAEEIIFEKGYRKIYDSGNLVFKWERAKNAE